MKRLLTCFLFFVCVSFCFSGPFGLEMGMTLDAVSSVCELASVKQVETSKSFDKWSIVPKKRHPLLSRYIVSIDSEKGLYEIVAESDFVIDSKYGERTQATFYDFIERLRKSYKKPTIVDLVSDNCQDFLKEENYWLKALKDGVRKLEAWWTSDLPDNLISVTLSAKAGIISTGNVVLHYEFKNKIDIINAQDEVL